VAGLVTLSLFFPGQPFQADTISAVRLESLTYAVHALVFSASIANNKDRVRS
jgi:hypothetical protein